MSKSIIVHGIAHQIQGSRFVGYVEDSSYAPWIRSLIRSNEIDFVYEEASGRGPSVAENLVRSLENIGYLDVDPSATERLKFGIAERVSEGGPIDPCHPIDIYELSNVGEQKKPEEEWLKRIQGTEFRNGLMIC